MATCRTCQRPLTLEIHNDEDEESGVVGGSSAQKGVTTVPDDVELVCGCHFHWQCLLDSYEVMQCPHCGENIASGNTEAEPQILCLLKNEGGSQGGIDILPVLNEELYLKAFPDDRKPRAFLEFCRAGDVEAIVDLLKANDEDQEDGEDEEMDGDEGDDDLPTSTLATSAILRYQDPIGSMRSGLHLAVQNGKEEVVWLLLFLASRLEHARFPRELLEAVGQSEIAREDQAGKTDIRTLKDSYGKTAASYVLHGRFGPYFDASILEVVSGDQEMGVTA